nr:hypothetical protein [Pseudoalteromonas sp. TB13]
MNPERNSFFDVNPALSQEIYKTFYGGSVINRKIYMTSQAQLVDSPLYIELRRHEDHYSILYKHLGFELTHDEKGEFMSLKLTSENESEETLFDETSLKIVAILTLVCRLISQRGQSLQLLSEPVQGVTPKDLSEIAEDKTAIAILSTIKIKSPEEAMEFMRKRGFCFKVSPSRYVLSKGAMSMIEVLIERESSLAEIQ